MTGDPEGNDRRGVEGRLSFCVMEDHNYPLACVEVREDPTFCVAVQWRPTKMESPSESGAPRGVGGLLRSPAPDQLRNRPRTTEIMMYFNLPVLAPEIIHIIHTICCLFPTYYAVKYVFNGVINFYCLSSQL